MLRCFSLLLVCLLVALLSVGCKKGDIAPVDLGRGALAPDFALRDTAGQTVSLGKYRGKVVFLNFWATWCPPCRSEMPSMERLNEVFASKEFVMLAVNVEQEGMANLGPFLQQNPHRFTVLLDTEAKAQTLYGVNRFPETFIIDKQGRIVERVIGARDWSSVEMLATFAGLIAQP